MKELYGIDMEKDQYSKLISDIPHPDIAISMGCNVGCPFIGRAFDDNLSDIKRKFAWKKIINRHMVYVGIRWYVKIQRTLLNTNGQPIKSCPFYDGQGEIFPTKSRK